MIKQNDNTMTHGNDNKILIMLSRRQPGFWWRPGCSRSSRRCSATPPLLLRVAVSWLRYNKMDFDLFDPDIQRIHNPGPQYTILLVLVFMFESVIGLLAYVYQVHWSYRDMMICLWSSCQVLSITCLLKREGRVEHYSKNICQ